MRLFLPEGVWHSFENRYAEPLQRVDAPFNTVHLCSKTAIVWAIILKNLFDMPHYKKLTSLPVLFGPEKIQLFGFYHYKVLLFCQIYINNTDLELLLKM